MKLPFVKINKAYLAVIIVAAVFLFGIFSAIGRGKAKADAKNIYMAVEQINKGLDFFYSDQNRFPTALEFSDSKVLRAYFSGEPDDVSKNTVCTKNFTYTRLSNISYRLDFCLADNLSPYSKGWNKIIIQK